MEGKAEGLRKVAAKLEAEAASKREEAAAVLADLDSVKISLVKETAVVAEAEEVSQALPHFRPPTNCDGRGFTCCGTISRATSSGPPSPLAPTPRTSSPSHIRHHRHRPLLLFPKPSRL